MDEVIEAIGEWKYLNQLPEHIDGFLLEQLRQKDGSLYRIFRYINPERHRMVEVLYDDATKDFLLRVTVGLTEYCDIGYISTTLPEMERKLSDGLQDLVSNLAHYCADGLCSVFRAKKITEWDYRKVLPETDAGFQLFIRPDEPVKVLNGSYIVIDYSDFLSDSNLIVYYNIFRDEFFGELRIHRTPQMARAFEAREIADLEEKLREHLGRTLLSIREAIENVPN